MLRSLGPVFLKGRHAGVFRMHLNRRLAAVHSEKVGSVSGLDLLSGYKVECQIAKLVQMDSKMFTLW